MLRITKHLPVPIIRGEKKIDNNVSRFRIHNCENFSDIQMYRSEDVLHSVANIIANVINFVFGRSNQEFIEIIQ